MKRSDLRQLIKQELKENWFDNMSSEKQKEYVKDHPDSKFSVGKKDDELKKIYHFRNAITGSRIDIKLTDDEAEKKKEQLGSRWKLLSTEEYLREVIQEVLNEKWKDDVEIKDTGEHADKTIEQLKKELAALKGKKPYNREKAGELMFAIRAKRNFKGGV